MYPTWLLNGLVTVMLVVAAVSATRIANACWPVNWRSAAPRTCSRISRTRRRTSSIDLVYLLMCIAMAGMLVPSLAILSPHTWEEVFGLLAAWFGCRLICSAKVIDLRSMVSGHDAMHLFHCAATVYMFSTMTTPYGIDLTGVLCGGIVPPAHHSVFCWIFALVLAGHSAQEFLGALADRRLYLGSARPASAIRVGNSGPDVACRVAMGVTMTFMLLTN